MQVSLLHAPVYSTPGIYAQRHAYCCYVLQVPVGGEDAAAEVAVVGSPQEFDFKIRSVLCKTQLYQHVILRSSWAILCIEQLQGCCPRSCDYSRNMSAVKQMGNACFSMYWLLCSYNCCKAQRVVHEAFTVHTVPCALS